MLTAVQDDFCKRQNYPFYSLMFIALFNENKDVFERMDAFKMQSAVLLEKYGNGAAQHYQYENAISTYLWLRYPGGQAAALVAACLCCGLPCS